METAPLSQHQELIQNRMQYMHVQDPFESKVYLLTL